MKTLHYMWNFKPGEQAPVPQRFIRANNKLGFRSKIWTPAQFTPLLEKHPKLKALWNQIPWWIVKADLGRWLIVYCCGGWYLDVDCVIHQNFLNQRKRSKSCFVFGFRHSKKKNKKNKKHKRKRNIVNFAFGARRRYNRWIGKMLDRLVSRVEDFIHHGKQITEEKDVLSLAGPLAVTKLFRQLHSKRVQCLKQKGFIHNVKFKSWRFAAWRKNQPRQQSRPTDDIHTTLQRASSDPYYEFRGAFLGPTPPRCPALA